MKKKLNVFCVLMLLIMAVEVVMTFVLSFGDYAQSFNEGLHDGRSKSITAVEVIMLVIAIPILYIMVRSFVSFIKFILNVNRDKVFVWENVPLLHWAGWGYLAGHVYTLIIDLLEREPLEKMYLEHTDGIVFAVFILIVAEVFTIGLKLKEEQELTI